jgi:signal transduction histidine kinase
LGASIDAALKFATGVKDLLFVTDGTNERDTRGRLNFSIEDRQSVTSIMTDVHHDLSELENFLGDLHFQFSKTHNTSFQVEVVDRFHSNVLMPLFRLAPAIAAVNSKLPPKISSFKKSGSLEIPKLMANKDALLSVFRNLIENSIKYTKDRVAEINLHFEEEDDFVSVFVSDRGIGISAGDEPHLFAEGFRSIQARLTSNRGGGLGLSYSQHVMRSLRGDLEHVPSETGATFRVRIRRAK